MRDVPASIAKAIAEGDFIGDRRAVARVTVQHPGMKLRHYALRANYPYLSIPTELMQTLAYDDAEDDGKYDDAKYKKALAKYKQFNARNSKKRKVNQTYADFLFTHLNKPLELPSVKTVEWQRSVDDNVASCTITIENTRQLEIGDKPLPGQLDLPGYYSPTRGGSLINKQIFHQLPNEFFGLIMPDNIIRTYEGYGADLSKPPELDTNLVQTGMWIIDSVDMSAGGTMSIKCRDIGRILMDQIYWKPVVPHAFQDEPWGPWKGTVTTATKGKLKVSAADSSNTPWIGSGNSVGGHALAHAFDANPNTYWLSIGNVAPSKRYAYEWVQCNVGNQTVSEVRVQTKKKGYVAYVSVKVAGVWQGTKSINYHRDGIGQNGGDIPYVKHANITSESETIIKFAPIKKVQAIRVTLGNLQNFKFGTYKYRAGIRGVAVYGTSSASTPGETPGPIGANPGRYSDYTHIIKLVCAWAGFFWPAGGKQRICNPPGTDPFAPIPGFNDLRDLAPRRYDSAVLGKGVKGRIWGDFQDSGTSGPAELDYSDFDKKSFMDVINTIKENLGFIFFVDELGGVQWRLPNIYNKGCTITDFTSTSPFSYRRGFVHFLSEITHMQSLSATLSGANVREGFFVGDAAGKVGSYAPGFNPNPTGLRRFAGWTDQNFAPETDDLGQSTKKQVADAQKIAEKTADLLALRQLWSYRVDQTRIAGNPAIQIDDQVRLMERTTSDGYVHYVKGISSSLDMQSGTWTYDLDTHWLGYSPQVKWLFSPGSLSSAVKEYLNTTLDLRGMNGLGSS